VNTPRILLRALPALVALAVTGPVLAADVYALTPAQKAAALQSGAEARDGDAALTGGGGSLLIHGEVGAAIGTGGYRSMYGTAAIPIGENGGAIVSFENSRFGDPRGR
jgi:hypothetical protein